MGLRCFLFGHINHERQWNVCAICGIDLPEEIEAPTFDEGYDFGVSTAANKILSYATKLELKHGAEYSTVVHYLREAGHQLKYPSNDPDWYKPEE